MKLYVDLSGSMRSFLDPEYSGGSQHYRFVLDHLLATVPPVATMGFGDRVRPIAASLEELGNRNRYSDANTRLEQVLTNVRSDSGADTTHVIIGDGRRGNPDQANGQFTAMRDLVTEWTDIGGSFAIAVSLAPFAPIQGDPAGCHRDATGQTGLTCPLYAFAFIRSQDASTMALRLVESFEHVFMYPPPAIHPATLVLRSEGEDRDFAFDRRWAVAQVGTPIANFTGASRSTKPYEVRLEPGIPNDAASSQRLSFLRALEPGQLILQRQLDADQHQAWRPVSGAAAHVTPSLDDPTSFRLLSRGRDASLFLYRVDLIPDAIPTWLRELDSQDVTDEVRTFGLGRVFPTVERVMSERRTVVTTVYIAVR